MGMQADLIAVDPEIGIHTGAMTDEEIHALLTGPDAAELDKSWEATFPLVGSIAGTGPMLVEDPLSVGGDLGFGPALFIGPEQAATIDVSLTDADAATVEQHLERLDSPFMSGGNYDDEDSKALALYGYRKIADVFAVAAAASQGVLFAIM